MSSAANNSTRTFACCSTSYDKGKLNMKWKFYKSFAGMSHVA